VLESVAALMLGFFQLIFAFADTGASPRPTNPPVYNVAGGQAGVLPC
jgi:hypothetical protein